MLIFDIIAKTIYYILRIFISAQRFISSNADVYVNSNFY